MEQLLFDVNYSVESQKKSNQEYNGVRIIFNSEIDEVTTKNNVYEGSNLEYKCDNSSNFKKLLNEKYPEFKTTLVSAIREETIESGVHYLFEETFDEYFKDNSYMATKLLEYFLRDFYADTKKVKAILHMVSHYSYEEMGEDFVYPILSLIGHCNKGIKKFALKVFDNWDSVETLQLLKGTGNPKERWLSEYKEKITTRLERKQTDAIFFTSN